MNISLSHLVRVVSYKGELMSSKSYQSVNRQRFRLITNQMNEVSLSEDAVIREEPLNIVLHWHCESTQKALQKNLESMGINFSYKRS